MMDLTTRHNTTPADTVDRDTVLNQAAVRLLTAAPDNAARLDSVRQLLRPLASSPDEPDWVRTALTSAVEIMDQALDGGLAWDGALARVGSLIELVMSGTRRGTGAAAPADAAQSYVLPQDAVHELVPDFVAESLDCVEQAETALLALERDPANADAINTVFRAFHTVKSTAAFLGLDPISNLAHSAETLLCAVRDGRAPFDGGLADVILACIDMMRELVEQVRSSMGSGAVSVTAPYTALLQRLADAATRLAAAPVPQRRVRARPAADIPPADSAPLRRWDDTMEPGVRVHTGRLDQLVDLVGELVVAQSMVAQDGEVTGNRHGELAGKVAHTARIVRELQDLAMSLRMVPLRSLFRKVQRLVRNLAKESGKDVELITEGEDTEIDRHMVDFLADPLVHMIRNAIDHGLEPPAERSAAGKPTVGTLRLAARHAGGAVVVELHDDGRGLDRDRILARAVDADLIAHDHAVTATEIDDLIFAPGLSTADSVTELSGRGVGMDVVRANVEALRGRVEVSSRRGLGTTFTLRLPLTLAITEGMLVRVGPERYIVPTVHIETSLRPTADALMRVVGGGELVVLHGDVIPILRLHAVFGIADAVTDPARGMLMVVGDAPRRFALLVDELLGQQQFVAKSVTAGLGPVPGLAGAAVLGNGHVGLILDPPAIAALAATPAARATGSIPVQ
jgi:two-component system, chemotaxis family, sensor kinase CheA